MRSKQSEIIGKHEGPQKKEQRYIEFSKIMAVIAITMWIFVNLFGMTMVIFTLDTSPLMYVIPSVDAVVAAIIAFYLWKARAENQIKLKRIYGVDVVNYDTDVPFGSPAAYENSHIV